MQLEKELIWDDALGCCFEVPPTQIDTDFTKQTQTLKYFSHFYRCWRPSRFDSPVFSTRNWGKLVAWNGTRLRLHPDSPAQTGMCSTKAQRSSLPMVSRQGSSAQCRAARLKHSESRVTWTTSVTATQKTTKLWYATLFFFFYLARLAERWFCLPGGYKPLTCACDTPAARENSHNWMLPCATTHTLQSWPLWEFIAQGHIAGG